MARPGLTIDAPIAEITEEKLYGRGSLEMNGGLALGIMVFDDVRNMYQNKCVHSEHVVGLGQNRFTFSNQIGILP
jgi:hypothetical protein